MYETKQSFLQKGGRGQVLHLVELLGFNSVFGASFLSAFDASLLLHLLQLFVESKGTQNPHYQCSETYTTTMTLQGKGRKDYKVPLSSLVHL